MLDIAISVDWGTTGDWLETMPERMRGEIASASERWGIHIRQSADDLSPDDKLRGTDSRRRPEGERLANSWRYSVGTTGDDTDVELYSVDPKAKWILFPTQAGAMIVSHGDYPLRFFTPDGHMHVRHTVRKGATPGQPVHLWAFDDLDFDDRVAELANRLVS